MNEIFTLQQKLAAAYGPSGRENSIADVIEELIRPYSCEITRDKIGNLIARKKGAGPRVAFSAHMDSLGLIVTYIDDNGFAYFSQVGGLNPIALIGTSVVFENGAEGVVWYSGKTEAKNAAISDLYIDIGAENAEEAAKLIRVGDIAVFSQTTRMLAGNIIASPYLDDRIACAVLIKTIESLPETDNDLYFIFSSQEELGLRGARCAAYTVEPEFAFAVDVCGVGDTPECKPKMACSLGNGAAIKIMDGSVICHPKVVSWLEEAADKAEIKHQREILRFGGTDAGALQTSRGGAYTGAISIPTRYIHNPLEVCSLFDVEECIKLCREACKIRL